MKTAAWNRKHSGFRSTVLGKEACTQLLEWIKFKAYSDTRGTCTYRHPFSCPPPPPPFQSLHLLMQSAAHFSYTFCPLDLYKENSLHQWYLSNIQSKISILLNMWTTNIPMAHLASIDQVSICHNVHRARQLPRWGLLWHFLKTNVQWGYVLGHHCGVLYSRGLRQHSMGGRGIGLK